MSISLSRSSSNSSLKHTKQPRDSLNSIITHQTVTHLQQKPYFTTRLTNYKCQTQHRFCPQELFLSCFTKRCRLQKKIKTDLNGFKKPGPIAYCRTTTKSLAAVNTTRYSKHTHTHTRHLTSTRCGALNFIACKQEPTCHSWTRIACLHDDAMNTAANQMTPPTNPTPSMGFK